MKLTYDPEHNIAYLRLHQKKKVQVDTIRVSDELNVDIAPDGTIYGIELLNAKTQLEKEADGNLVTVSTVVGQGQPGQIIMREKPAAWKTKQGPGRE